MSLELKIKLQKEAELAHIKIGLKSTVTMSVGTGKGVIALNRIIAVCKSNKKAKCLFFGDKTIYLTNFKMEFKKFKAIKYLKQVDMCCIDSLHKFNSKYDLIIYDEAHLSTEIGYNYLLEIIKLNPKVEILCLTGTPKNTDSFKELLKICPVSYSKLIDDSIEDKIINDYQINVIKIPLSTKTDIHIKTDKYDFWTSEQKSYDRLYTKYLNKEYSNKFPIELSNLKTFLKNTKSKLEYVKTFIESLNFEKLLVYAGSIDQSELIGYKTYHSKLSKEVKEKNYKDFYKGKIDILINVSGLKESVSISNLTHGIVMSPEASESSMVQLLGRFCRLLPGDNIGQIYIFIFKDTIEEEWFKKASKNLDQTKIK